MRSADLLLHKLGTELDISKRTVEVHKANAYEKLGITNLAQLFRIVAEESTHIRRKYPQLHLEKM